ncbi:MAG: hypothetical protein EBQ87_17780, partial [Planctomycetes bacterium]|nr:hypothetical protein [Planctomycetota bacterium]
MIFARLLSLLLISILISSGCSTFNFNPDQTTGKESGKANTSNTPILPGKFLIRVAPYVFLSDFEIQKDLPLFDELAKLRDQVYGDLKLPESSTMIQVYL